MDMRPLPAMTESLAVLLAGPADQNWTMGGRVAAIRYATRPVTQLRPRPPRTSVLAAKLVWLGRPLRRFIVIAKGRECLDHVIILGERQ